MMQLKILLMTKMAIVIAYIVSIIRKHLQNYIQNYTSLRAEFIATN